jgi:hypothetical protein
MHRTYNTVRTLAAGQQGVEKPRLSDTSNGYAVLSRINPKQGFA